MEYYPVSLRRDIDIEGLVSVRYFEYTMDYSYPGEKHDFWELVFVDKGEVIVGANDKKIVLKAGDIIFHKPNEWHSIAANGHNAANVAIVSFICNSPVMSFFENRLTRTNLSQRWLIARITDSARLVFKTHLGNPYVQKMVKRDVTPIGSEQLISIYIEELLFSFIQSEEIQKPEIKTTHKDEFNRIVSFMEDNICKKLTMDIICKKFNISFSTLKKLFKENAKKGVITYFTEMKIEYAKQLIREGHHNIMQIARILGYETPNYFSLRFKQCVKMTPTEYAKSIKSLQNNEYNEE